MNIVGTGLPPAAAAGLSIRARLRAGTADNHARVDHAFGRHDLGTRAGYGAFLAIHAAALLPLEAALKAAGVADILPDWPRRRRSAALCQDLTDLGVAPAQPVAVTLDTAPAALLGTLYVLEGSRMGAAYLLRAVGASDDATVRAATRYLAHGRGLGLWPAFVAQLEESEAVAAAPERTLAAADATFAVFLAALEQGPSARAGQP